jgi:hypothetical protein
MEVRFQLQALAALAPGNNPHVHFVGSWEGPSGRYGEEKKTLTPVQARTPIELSRLPVCNAMLWNGL